MAAIAEKHDVVGVECSPQALAYARQTLGDRVRNGRLPDEIDLPPASFDVVLLTDVLEHIEDDAASARTALTLLRPGGIVVATVPAYQWLYSPRDAHHHHFRRYGKQQFAALWKSAAAETLLLSHYNTLLFPPAAAVRLASKLFASRTKPGDLALPPRSSTRCSRRAMGSEANLLGPRAAAVRLVAGRGGAEASNAGGRKASSPCGLQLRSPDILYDTELAYRRHVHAIRPQCRGS